MDKYLAATPILDYNSRTIQRLIGEKGWSKMEDQVRVREIYNFVRDDIRFGYNRRDDIPASEVLSDGYGQCNTKANLLMAILRAVGIPCRIHGFTINKALQKGAITGIWYRLAPQNILHSWVEVNISGRWYALEGVILDKPYLCALQRLFGENGSSFCGYGAFTEDFLNPKVDFDMNDTFIQEKGIINDFGLFNNPDEFYKEHRQKLPYLKRTVYQYLVRHLMNKNVQRIRNGSDDVI